MQNTHTIAHKIKLFILFLNFSLYFKNQMMWLMFADSRKSYQIGHEWKEITSGLYRQRGIKYNLYRIGAFNERR